MVSLNMLFSFLEYCSCFSLPEHQLTPWAPTPWLAPAELNAAMCFLHSTPSRSSFSLITVDYFCLFPQETEPLEGRGWVIFVSLAVVLAVTQCLKGIFNKWANKSALNRWCNEKISYLISSWILPPPPSVHTTKKQLSTSKANQRRTLLTGRWWGRVRICPTGKGKGILEDN